MPASIYGTTPIAHTNLTSTQRIGIVDPNLYMEFADKIPFLTYLLQQGIRNVGDWKHTHHTKSYIPRYSTVNHSAGYSSSATSIVVTDGTVFRPNDLVAVYLSADPEIMRVASISGNTLTVGRGVGGTTAASITDGAYLLNLGPAFRHGENIGEHATMAAVAVTSYVQYWEKVVRVNKQTTGVSLVGGDPRMLERTEKLNELFMDISRAIITGAPGNVHTSGTGSGSGATLGADASTAYPLYITKSVRATASTYTQSEFSSGITRGTLTETEWNAFLHDKVFAENRGGTMPLFASARVIKAIDYWARSKLQYAASDVIQGISCTKYRTTAGEVELFYEPALSDAVSGYGFDGCAFSFVPGQVFLIGVSGNGLVMEEDAVKDGTEQYVDKWKGGMGLAVINEKYLAWLEGVSAGA